MKPKGKLPDNYHYQYAWMESEIKRLVKVNQEYWVAVCQLAYTKRALGSEREMNEILSNEIDEKDNLIESLRKELTELKHSSKIPK